MKREIRRRVVAASLAIVSLGIPLAASAVDYTVSTVAGAGSGTCTTTPTLASSVAIPSPWGMTSDQNGNVWYTDRSNYVICKITPDGNVVRVAGTGIRGIGADNVQATQSELYDPISVAVDSTGALYIAEYSGAYSIRKVGLDGVITTIFNVAHGATTSGTGGLATAASSAGITALAISQTDEVYFSEYLSSLVRKIDSSGYVRLVAGTGTTTNAGDGGLATAASVANPAGIAFDKSGNLYIAQYVYTIRKIDTSGYISRFAGQYGVSTHTGDGGLATSATFKIMWGITTDGVGNVYVTERGGSTIRKITASTGIVTTLVGVDGSPALVDGSTSVARIGTSYSVAFTPNGDLYFGEVSNSRIRKVAGAGEMSNTTPPTISYNPLNTYKFGSALVASGGANGKITFFANGKRIPGCISVNYTGSFTCSWKPALHGANLIYASVVTASNTTIKTTQVSVGVQARTSRR